MSCTIIEGTLAENKYGDMLSSVLKRADCVFAYYYDLSFEEAVKRHETKDYTDFNSNQMKDWLVPHNFLGIENEKILSETLTKDDVIKLILTDLGIVG